MRRGQGKIGLFWGEYSILCLVSPQGIIQSLEDCKKKKHMDILIPIRLSASPLSLLVCLSVKMRDVRAEGPCQMERGPTPPQVPSTQRFRRRPSKHIHRIQRVNSINTGRRGPHIRRTGCAVSS